MQNTPLPDRSDSQENTYRWPQKVHRYGLMKHPFLRLFVALFENQIPWNTRPQGWNAESLREHIRTHMLPALEPVDPRIAAHTAFGAAYYIDRINLDAALQEATDRKLERLREIRELNPRVAARAAIRHFNQQKYKAFQAWWGMMQRHFSSKPEWTYCLLRRVFSTSTRNSRAPVPAVRLKTVRKVADAVIRSEVLPSVGLADAYLRYSAALHDTASKFHPHGWTRVEREPGNENPSKTSLLSYFGARAGWCIRNRDTASHYLQNSDFYVLCSGGSPVVALRIGEETCLTRPTVKVREVTGIRNRLVKEYPAVDLLIAVLRGAKDPLQSEDLQTGSRLSSLDLEGWSRVLETVPFALRYAPAQVRHSGAIREKVRASLMRYIRRDSFWVRFILRMDAGVNALSDDVEFLLDETLRSTALPVAHVGRHIFRNPRLRAAWEASWVRHLQVNTTTVGVPRRILTAPENRTLARAALKSDMDAGRPVPLYNLNPHDPELSETWRQQWIRLLESPASVHTVIPRQLSEDRQIVAAWMLNHSRTALKGTAPACAPGSGPLLFAGWCGLWISALKAVFKQTPSKLRKLFIPKVLRRNPAIRRTLLDGWIGHLKGNATTVGVPRRVLALPEVRPLALDAFRIDLACHQQPPLFHTFYAEEPGLWEEWHQAWVRYLRTARRAALEIPAQLRSDKKIFSAWFTPHLRACRSGELPPDAPKGWVRHSIWRALWIVSVKAIFSKPGDSSCSVRIPPELLKLRSMQRTLITGWLSALEKQMQKDASSRFIRDSEPLFLQLLFQVCEGLGCAEALRDFVFGYLRLAARLKQSPCFETLAIQNTHHPLKQQVLAAFGEDPEFQSLWKAAWLAATLAKITTSSQSGSWIPFRMPQETAIHPAVRTAAREAYIAFLGRRETDRSTDLSQHIATPTEEGSTAQSERPEEMTPAMRCAEETALALFEHIALGENFTTLATLPKTVAGNPELSRAWQNLWPKRVAARINVDNVRFAAGCGDTGLPRQLWDSRLEIKNTPSGDALLKEILMRFLSTRGKDRPLATNDSLPPQLTKDPEAIEAWIDTWERVLRAMPGEYAGFDRVALNVQHSARVFRAWLQAVGPLNRPLAEEEGWRRFLMLCPREAFPPFLPRAEIWQRNSSLRGLVRERLKAGGQHAAPGGDDFVSRGIKACLKKRAEDQAEESTFQPEDTAMFCKAYAIATRDGHPGPIDASDEAILARALDSLRATPWLLESLPPAYAGNGAFLEAVLSGWEAYLGPAPWLLPSIPASCRRHFRKTRAGVQRVAPNPVQRVPDRPLSAAA